MSTSPTRFEIYGCGFSGLSLAYFLKKYYPQTPLILYEAESQVGGLLALGSNPSIQKLGGNIFAESAANGMLNSAEIEDCARDIGVTLLSADPRFSKSRFIFSGGKPRRFPLNLFEILRSALGVVVCWLLGSLGPRQKETARSWSRRVFGSAFTSKLLEPALGGIYAAPLRDLSASVLVGSFLKRRKLKKSLPKNRRRSLRTVCPPGGMRSWCEALKDYLNGLHGVEFRQQTSYDLQNLLVPASPGSLRFYCGGLGPLLSFIKTPKSDGFNLYRQKIQEYPLSFCSVASVTVEFREPPQSGLIGFGCLFSRDENFNSLGVLFNSCVFPQRYQNRSETYIFGRSESFDLESVFSLNLDEQKRKEILLSRLLEDRGRMLRRKVQALEVVGYQSFYWPKAFVTYDCNLEEWIASGTFEKMELDLDCQIFGNFRGQLGLTQIFNEAKTIAEKIKLKF